MFTNLRKQYYDRKSFFTKKVLTVAPPNMLRWCQSLAWSLCTVICTFTNNHVIAAHIVLVIFKMCILLLPSVTFNPALLYFLSSSPSAVRHSLLSLFTPEPYCFPISFKCISLLLEFYFVRMFDPHSQCRLFPKPVIDTFWDLGFSLRPL